MREKRRGFFICFMLWMVWSAKSSWSQTNLLQDPGFENWSSGNSLVNWEKESGITLTQESSVNHGGGYSSKMQLTGATDRLGIYQDIPVVVGNVYTLKVWLYDAGGVANAGISIIWYDSKKEYLYKYAGPEKTNIESSWQQVSVTATAPANAAYARCRVRIYDSKDYPCYADDAEFYTDVPLSVKVNSCRAVGQSNSIVVQWQTESEVGTMGFYVLRAECESGPYQQVSTSMIPGQRNSPNGKEYVYQDKNIETGKRYWYQIVELEENGNRNQVGQVQAILRTEGIVPKISTLISNYPNPFNPSTTIRFWVSREDAESCVSLSIYNILGKEIKTLVQNTSLPGEYSAVWDGRDGDGREAESGMYFCILKTPEMIIESQKMNKTK